MFEKSLLVLLQIEGASQSKSNITQLFLRCNKNTYYESTIVNSSNEG